MTKLDIAFTAVEIEKMPPRFQHCREWVTCARIFMIIATVRQTKCLLYFLTSKKSNLIFVSFILSSIKCVLIQLNLIALCHSLSFLPFLVEINTFPSISSALLALFCSCFCLAELFFVTRWEQFEPFYTHYMSLWHFVKHWLNKTYMEGWK